MVHPKALDAFSIVMALSGLYWFASSFFLAKRSLEYASSCDENAQLLASIGLSEEEIRHLRDTAVLMESQTSPREGCWMERQVDSMIILLVDALRFDFAYYALPHSVGKRLSNPTNRSKLYQFLADPPTVTMQRLKALTTGGLPTFADISGNFGGATVEEDSWVSQLNITDFRKRNLRFSSKTGFVGDDTWEDLYPGYFTHSFPYPSFNTRDLDTVDNGCLKHLPDLLHQWRHKDATASELELVVVHFLGVDHVGHTYGPHNEHMDTKLREMDAALETVLETLDQSEQCHAAFIFGDHGMTEDGNHGGGTTEETNAALFAHVSPACGPISQTNLEAQTTSAWVQDTFSSIHQIDLVPTMSILLGLPVPYANLGGIVPSLLPMKVRSVTAALALNAAQVWRYYTVYSEEANQLPDLLLLEERLKLAVSEYKRVLASGESDDRDEYEQVAGLFKTFLVEALELGQRVWTRFDNVGMISGVVVLFFGMLAFALPLWLLREKPRERLPRAQLCEISTTFLFMVYICGVVTFSNSYILEEENAITYCLAVLSIMVFCRVHSEATNTGLAWIVILLPLASRLHELFVSGHGLDPSIRLHAVHHSLVFLPCLALLGVFRIYLYRLRLTTSLAHVTADLISLVCLACGWWEKRSLNPDRNGYIYCQVALVLLFGGIPIASLQAVLHKGEQAHESHAVNGAIMVVIKVLLAIMTVTGPATGASAVLYALQASVVFVLVNSGSFQINSSVVAALWRLVTRHTFFASNHGCFFNRLQYSAAFVATKEFYFVTGGISLFLNTFGWEMVGIIMAWLFSQRPGRKNLFRVYGLFQLLEAFTSCISVSILRRHLMVWDIYAPHFLFASIYTVLSMLSQLTQLLLSDV